MFGSVQPRCEHVNCRVLGSIQPRCKHTSLEPSCASAQGNLAAGPAELKASTAQHGTARHGTARHSTAQRACLGLFKSLLQEVLHILVNAVQLVLLDLALLQQLGPVLLVTILMLLDGLHTQTHTDVMRLSLTYTACGTPHDGPLDGLHPHAELSRISAGRHCLCEPSCCFMACTRTQCSWSCTSAWPVLLVGVLMPLDGLHPHAELSRISAGRHCLCEPSCCLMACKPTKCLWSCISAWPCTACGSPHAACVPGMQLAMPPPWWLRVLLHHSASNYGS